MSALANQAASLHVRLAASNAALAHVDAQVAYMLVARALRNARGERYVALREQHADALRAMRTAEQLHTEAVLALVDAIENGSH